MHTHVNAHVHTLFLVYTNNYELSYSSVLKYSVHL